MTDTLTRAERSRRMQHIRGRDTALEVEFRKALWSAGLRGWRCHVSSVVGKPDLVWKSKRVAVFIDSAWWHGHPSRWRPGKLSPWWDAKIDGNRRRDREVNRTLRRHGWTVVRVWDFEIDRDLEDCIARVARAIERTTS